MKCSYCILSQIYCYYAKLKDPLQQAQAWFDNKLTYEMPIHCFAFVHQTHLENDVSQYTCVLCLELNASASDFQAFLSDNLSLENRRWLLTNTSFSWMFLIKCFASNSVHRLCKKTVLKILRYWRFVLFNVMQSSGCWFIFKISKQRLLMIVMSTAKKVIWGRKAYLWSTREVVQLLNKELYLKGLREK